MHVRNNIIYNTIVFKSKSITVRRKMSSGQYPLYVMVVCKPVKSSGLDPNLTHSRPS